MNSKYVYKMGILRVGRYNSIVGMYENFTLVQSITRFGPQRMFLMDLKIGVGCGCNLRFFLI